MRNGFGIRNHDDDDEKQIKKVINEEIMKTQHDSIRQHIKTVLSTSMLTRYSGNGKLFGIKKSCDLIKEFFLD